MDFVRVRTFSAILCDINGIARAFDGYGFVHCVQDRRRPDDYTNTKAIVLSSCRSAAIMVLGCCRISSALSNGDSSDAVTSRALLIFVFSISALFEVIYKIYQALYQKSNPSTPVHPVFVSQQWDCETISAQSDLATSSKE